MSLSAYELQRLENIARNEAHLTALGLNDSVVPKKKPAPKKRKSAKDEDPEYKPMPRQTRARSGSGKAVAYVSDDDNSDDDSDYDSDEEQPPTSRKQQRPKKPPVQKVKLAPNKHDNDLFGEDDDDDDGDETKCVVVEAAKTGRSKCRGCMENIQEGEARVGMESWMVGRQVVVWQHPKCFLAQVAAVTQTGGKRKCKQTKRGFAAGERSLSFTAHSTTNHVKLGAAGELLAPVLRAAALPAPAAKAKLGSSSHTAVDALRRAMTSPETFDVLDAADIAVLAAGLAKGSGGGDADVGSTPSQADAMTPKPEGAEGGKGSKDGDDKTKRQPAAGSVAKAKGKVCWTWAGSLCYGTLIANSETKTHCYARTQRGNTKTLTKGGSYWWML